MQTVKWLLFGYLRPRAGASTPAATSLLLLTDGTSYLLLTNGSDRLALAGNPF